MRRHAFLPGILLSFVFLMAGCGGGSGNNGGGGGVPGITIKVTSPAGPAAADAGQALNIVVEVDGDSSNAGVTWSVAPTHKGDPAGTLSSLQATSAIYNPPGSLTAPEQVVVLATSVSDPTRSAAIPISLYPTPTITTQTSDLDTAFVGTDYTCYIKPIPLGGVTQIPCAVDVSGGLGPYTWSLGNTLLPDGMTLAPSPGGLIGPNATVVVGPPTQIGPDPIVGVHSFSLKATDSLGVSTNVSLSISVAPSQLKVVTPTLLSTFKNVPYTSVVMQTSAGTGPYTWRLAPGSGPLPPGMTLNPNGTISGTPTTDASAQFAVQVFDTQTPVPAQATFPTPVANPNANIMALAPAPTVDPDCQTGGNTLQSGTPYAFSFTGFDSDGPVTLSGSFVMDNAGNLTGVEDIIRASGTNLGQAFTAGSSVQFSATSRGCLTLNTALSSTSFRVAPTAQTGVFYSEGTLTEFDDQTGDGVRGTGSFHLQDQTAFSTSFVSGPYAFGFSGWNASGGHFAMVGTATAASGLFTSVSADVNNAGTFSGALVGGSGTIGSVDGNGRGTATIGVGPGTYNLIFYVVDANHLIFNSTGPATSTHPLITGEATSSVGPFSQATLINSHIYRFGGSLPGSPDVGIGVLHFDGVGAVSGTAFERTAGTASSTTVSGQYAMDPTTGRFTFSGTTVPAVGYAIPAVSGTTAYLVGTGSSASSGVMEFQTDKFPPGYQVSPIQNNYGFTIDRMLDGQSTAFNGLWSGVTLDGKMNLDASYLDISRPGGPGTLLLPAQKYEMFRYTFNADGSGAFGGDTYMVTNGTKVFYIDISPLSGHPVVVVGRKR